MINWTPEGMIGDLFRTMGPYMPPPPPGASPPPTWGSEDHVRELLGEGVSDLDMTRHTLSVDLFDTPVAYRDYFKARYGPTIVAYGRNAEDPDKVRELDDALAELCERRNAGPEGGRAHFDLEYLLVLARRV